MNEAERSLNVYFADASGGSDPANLQIALLKLAAAAIGDTPYTGKTPLTAALAYIEFVVGPGRVITQLRTDLADILNKESQK